MIWFLAAACAVFALGLGGARLVRRAAGAHGAGPRTMLALWTLATAVWIASCVALAALLTAELLGPAVKGVVAACLSLLQALERREAAPGVGAAAALLLLGSVRLAWTGLRRGWAGRSWRRSHDRELRAGARRRTLHGQRVWLVDTPERGAYCVPGSRGGVVVTSGALAALSERQTRAVLAHERAHLAGRHHLLVGWARLLAAAFPRVPLLRAAAHEVPVLVEWAADDRAVREVGTRPLVYALARLAEPRADHGDAAPALSIGGACPVERVRRQIARTRERPRPRARALVRVVPTVVLLAAPLLFTVAATVVGVLAPHCDCAA